RPLSTLRLEDEVLRPYQAVRGARRVPGGDAVHDAQDVPHGGGFVELAEPLDLRLERLTLDPLERCQCACGLALDEREQGRQVRVLETDRRTVALALLRTDGDERGLAVGALIGSQVAAIDLSLDAEPLPDHDTGLELRS